MSSSTPPRLTNLSAYSDEHLVTLSDVAEIADISKQTIYRWIKSGRLPTPTKFGPNTVRFRLGAIRAALAALEASSAA